MKRLIVAATICAACLGGASVPSGAADLGPGVAPRIKPMRSAWRDRNWYDRCVRAHYYCLYAWHGTVYRYRWDQYVPGYGYRNYRRRY